MCILQPPTVRKLGILPLLACKALLRIEQLAQKKKISAETAYKTAIIIARRYFKEAEYLIPNFNNNRFGIQNYPTETWGCAVYKFV